MSDNPLDTTELAEGLCRGLRRTRDPYRTARRPDLPERVVEDLVRESSAVG